MAFNRELDDDPNNLQRQLEAQLNPPAQPGLPPVNVAQVGAERGVLAPGPIVPMPSMPSMSPAAPAAPDRAAQAKASQAAGYTDIGDTNPLKTGAHMGKLEGFNTQGWGSGERGSGTMKNKFGQIASRYDPTQAGAAKAMMADEDFRSFWPDATIVEHPNQDLIDFDGPGGQAPVDVLRAATAGGGGEGWQWGVEDGGAAPAGAGGGFDMQSLISGIGGGGDPMAAIQAELAKHAGNGQDDPQSLIEQLLAQQGAP